MRCAGVIDTTTAYLSSDLECAGPKHGGYLHAAFVSSQDFPEMSSAQKVVHFSVTAVFRFAVSIIWLLMNLSSRSYAIAQQAWQCAPDSFVKIFLIVQRLYYNVQE